MTLIARFRTGSKPTTSRLLDEKQKRYNNRALSNKRAISYTELNQSAGTGKGGESHV